MVGTCDYHFFISHADCEHYGRNQHVTRPGHTKSGTEGRMCERIVALKAVGVDLILSGFLHFHEEVEYFGRKVLPLVRELEREAVTAKAAALA